jgi:N-acetylglutamate synthase-like GNAT family acetyltransferase
MIAIRPARPPDLPHLDRLLAPARAAGELRHRELTADTVLVAETADGRLVGAVAVVPWSADVVELCSLFSGVRGVGLGSALTRAAVDRARSRGSALVVALTHRADFFGRQGFEEVHDRPWARARGLAAVPAPDHPELAPAVASKARAGCASCPALGRCRQALFVQRLVPAARRAVA